MGATKISIAQLVSLGGLLALCGCARFDSAGGLSNGGSNASSQSSSTAAPTLTSPSATPSQTAIPSPVASPTPSPTSTPSPSPTPQPRASNAANITVCPGSATLPGLDVSDYDPGTQWNVLAANGNQFAYIKATEGVTFTNDLFKTDWPAAKAAGLARGAYHFYHPSDDPVQQAQFYLQTVGTLAANDLPPMLDWETSDGVSNAQQIANAMTWLTLVESATGRTPIIYVDPSYWNSLGNPVAFFRFPLFIAEYDVACPRVPPPWNTWSLWQKATAPLAGVASPEADIDVFNGTLNLLQQLGH